MNLPNRLTVSRLFLAAGLICVLPLAGIIAKIASLLIFIVASLTDLFDGKIARRTGEITPLGSFLDPLADKALTYAALGGFFILEVMPAWMILLMALRDVLVTGFRLTLNNDSEKMSARKSGKQKTLAQFFTTLIILLYLILRQTSFWEASYELFFRNYLYALLCFMVGITLYSGVEYLQVNWTRESLVKMIATFSGAGYSRWAPGTMGSLAGVAIAWFAEPFIFYPALLICLALGFLASGASIKIFKSDDPACFVMDEVCGVMIAVCLVPKTWPLYAMGFLLFRFFDITKPWPISLIQKSKHFSSIMLDDILAGAFAFALLHGYLFLILK